MPQPTSRTFCPGFRFSRSTNSCEHKIRSFFSFIKASKDEPWCASAVGKIRMMLRPRYTEGTMSRCSVHIHFLKYYIMENSNRTTHTFTGTLLTLFLPWWCWGRLCWRSPPRTSSRSEGSHGWCTAGCPGTAGRCRIHFRCLRSEAPSPAASRSDLDYFSSEKKKENVQVEWRETRVWAAHPSVLHLRFYWTSQKVDMTLPRCRPSLSFSTQCRNQTFGPLLAPRLVLIVPGGCTVRQCGSRWGWSPSWSHLGRKLQSYSKSCHHQEKRYWLPSPSIQSFMVSLVGFSLHLCLNHHYDEGEMWRLELSTWSVVAGLSEEKKAAGPQPAQHLL